MFYGGPLKKDKTDNRDSCRVAEMLAAIHGWTAQQKAAMLDEYKAEVELSRRWR